MQTEQDRKELVGRHAESDGGVESHPLLRECV